jgi:hypothetical protein
MARKKQQMQALSDECLEGASGGMSATIDGIRVDGTPQEIAELVQSMKGGDMTRSASMPNMTATAAAPPPPPPPMENSETPRPSDAWTYGVTQDQLKAFKFKNGKGINMTQ